MLQLEYWNPEILTKWPQKYKLNVLLWFLRYLNVQSISQILPDKPDLSRWSLKYKAFGRDIEYSWLARNMQEMITFLI